MVESPAASRVEAMAVLTKTVRRATRKRGTGKASGGSASVRTASESGLPIHIRNFGTSITSADRDYIRRKLAARLARFAARRAVEHPGGRAPLPRRSRTIATESE
jgi:hypothetical protein